MEKLQILHGILNYTELEIIKKQIRVIKDSYLFFYYFILTYQYNDNFSKKMI